MNDFSILKYGLFVHYVTELAFFSSGRKPSNADDAVNSFNVDGFIDHIASMKVQYIILTAWHYNMIPLYPSEVTDKWRRVSSPRRDLLGEIIDGLNEKNIKVILYTHPRDGHDFSDDDRILTGWGIGNIEGDLSTPSPENFDYRKWNSYINELYEELGRRYAKKLFGFYTDGTGPYKRKDPHFETNMQIVDYLSIREIMKKYNPEIIMIQNYFGYIFSNDYAMPEGYFGYEEQVSFRSEKLPAAQKALALCPFKDWFPTSVSENVPILSTPIETARFTIFNSSASIGGGTVWACGPFAEGDLWQKGVKEYMCTVGELLTPYFESAIYAAPSLSYPTLSGDTLEDIGYKFFTTSDDKKFEYLHLMHPSFQNEISFGIGADKVDLTDPVSLCASLSITSFKKDGNGYRLTLDGDWSEIDNVIRFSRKSNEKSDEYEWINDTDKRIRYEGNWLYKHLQPTQQCPLGCFESDLHRGNGKGSSLFLAFEGSYAEIYARTSPDGGSADVYMDGIKKATSDTKNETEQKRNLIYRSQNLCGGIHTLYIVLKDNGEFDLDAIKIYK